MNQELASQEQVIPEIYAEEHFLTLYYSAKSKKLMKKLLPDYITFKL